MFYIVDLRAGLYAQAFLFGIYVLLAVWGLIQWGREKHSEEE